MSTMGMLCRACGHREVPGVYTCRLCGWRGLPPWAGPRMQREWAARETARLRTAGEPIPEPTPLPEPPTCPPHPPTQWYQTRRPKTFAGGVINDIVCRQCGAVVAPGASFNDLRRDRDRIRRVVAGEETRR